MEEGQLRSAEKVTWNCVEVSSSQGGRGVEDINRDLHHPHLHSAQGWTSSRKSSRVESLIFELKQTMNLMRIDLLPHQTFVAKKVYIYVADSGGGGREVSLDKLEFEAVVKVQFFDTRSYPDEFRNVHLDAKGDYVKLEFSKPLPHPENNYEREANESSKGALKSAGRSKSAGGPKAEPAHESGSESDGVWVGLGGSTKSRTHRKESRRRSKKRVEEDEVSEEDDRREERRRKSASRQRRQDSGHDRHLSREEREHKRHEHRRRRLQKTTNRETHDRNRRDSKEDMDVVESLMRSKPGEYPEIHRKSKALSLRRQQRTDSGTANNSRSKSNDQPKGQAQGDKKLSEKVTRAMNTGVLEFTTLTLADISTDSNSTSDSEYNKIKKKT